MSLIERLESAEVGSRELDYAIKAALEPMSEYCTTWSPRVTTSIDAALDLAERLGLLGSVVIEAGTSGKAWVVSWRDSEDFYYGPTPALALCIAILKAKETK